MLDAVATRRATFWFLVTCADYAPWIEECLESVAAQEDEAIGLLVACDGSTDGTDEIVRRFLADNPKFADVRVHVHEERAGKAQRVYELMQELRTEAGAIVAFLDGDDRLVHTQAAHRMKIEFERGADVAWSNFRYRVPKAEGPGGMVGICGPMDPTYDVYGEPYVSSHLFCFRAADFFAIPAENYKDSKGAFFRRGCDQCFTLPLTHQAQRRRFVREFFVEYNNATPWQNDGDGTAAATAVETVRRRRWLDGSARGRMSRIATDVALQLADLQGDDGDLPESSYYGLACAAATWMHVDGDYFVDHIRRAWTRVDEHQDAASSTGDPQYHWEFDLLASTSVGFSNDPGARVDNRRVLNWQLLLTLVDLRLGLGLRTGVLDRVEANVGDDGELPDFDRDVDETASYSDQYQAFCAYLLDEIRALTPDSRVARLADRCGSFVVQRARTGDVNRDGRGRHQLFGYAAAARVLLARGEDALVHGVLDRIEGARWQRGLFPLCLDDALQCFASQPGWHGYNRYFDYLAFTGLLFAEGGTR